MLLNPALLHSATPSGWGCVIYGKTWHKCPSFSEVLPDSVIIFSYIMPWSLLYSSAKTVITLYCNCSYSPFLLIKNFLSCRGVSFFILYLLSPAKNRHTGDLWLLSIKCWYLFYLNRSLKWQSFTHSRQSILIDVLLCAKQERNTEIKIGK